MKYNVDRHYIEELLYDISIGKKDSLELLYNLTKTSVFGFAFSILKNQYDAEDVMQDTFVNINRYASVYNSKGKPLAWILTITKNLCFQKNKKSKRTDNTSEEDFEKIMSSSVTDTKYDMYFLKSILKSLNDEERKIIMLSSVSGFKHREIAEMLDLNISTVLSKYHRAIKKIRSIYREVENV